MLMDLLRILSDQREELYANVGKKIRTVTAAEWLANETDF